MNFEKFVLALFLGVMIGGASEQIKMIITDNAMR